MVSIHHAKSRIVAMLILVFSFEFGVLRYVIRFAMSVRLVSLSSAAFSTLRGPGSFCIVFEQRPVHTPTCSQP
jgi:hypothetical protein